MEKGKEKNIFVYYCEDTLNCHLDYLIALDLIFIFVMS